MYLKTLVLFLAISISQAMAAKNQFSTVNYPQQFTTNQISSITYTITNNGPTVQNFNVKLTSGLQLNSIDSNNIKYLFTAAVDPNQPQTCSNIPEFKTEDSCTFSLIFTPTHSGRLPVPAGNKITYSIDNVPVAATFIPAPPSAQAAVVVDLFKPSAVYFFGDSYSDIGNLATSPGVYPPVITTKWSYLVAQDLGYTLAPSVAGGTDYAIGGSVSGPLRVYNKTTKSYDLNSVQVADDPANSGLTMDLLSQISRFAKDHNNQADPNALYFIWAGGNDFGTYIGASNSNYVLDPQYGPDEMLAEAKQIYVNIQTAVDELQIMGARNIVVVNLSDFSSMSIPYFNTTYAMGLSDQQMADRIAVNDVLVTEYNQLLATNVAEWNVEHAALYSNYKNVIIIDSEQLLAAVSAPNNSQCGFKDAMSPASICITDPKQSGYDNNCNESIPKALKTGVCCDSTDMAKAIIPFLDNPYKMCSAIGIKTNPQASLFNATTHLTAAGDQYTALNIQLQLNLPHR